jgi:hypothetical protein
MLQLHILMDGVAISNQTGSWTCELRWSIDMMVNYSHSTRTDDGRRCSDACLQHHPLEPSDRPVREISSVDIQHRTSVNVWAQSVRLAGD